MAALSSSDDSPAPLRRRVSDALVARIAASSSRVVENSSCARQPQLRSSAVLSASCLQIGIGSEADFPDSDADLSEADSRSESGSSTESDSSSDSQSSFDAPLLTSDVKQMRSVAAIAAAPAVRAALASDDDDELTTIGKHQHHDAAPRKRQVAVASRGAALSSDDESLPVAVSQRCQKPQCRRGGRSSGPRPFEPGSTEFEKHCLFREANGLISEGAFVKHGVLPETLPMPARQADLLHIIYLLFGARGIAPRSVDQKWALDQSAVRRPRKGIDLKTLRLSGVRPAIPGLRLDGESGLCPCICRRSCIWMNLEFRFADAWDKLRLQGVLVCCP